MSSVSTHSQKTHRYSRAPASGGISEAGSGPFFCIFMQCLAQALRNTPGLWSNFGQTVLLQKPVIITWCALAQKAFLLSTITGNGAIIEQWIHFSDPHKPLFLLSQFDPFDSVLYAKSTRAVGLLYVVLSVLLGGIRTLAASGRVCVLCCMWKWCGPKSTVLFLCISSDLRLKLMWGFSSVSWSNQVEIFQSLFSIKFLLCFSAQCSPVKLQ